MAQQVKICPICGSRAHRSAVICPVCGTSLQDVEAAKDDTRPIRPIQPRYDSRYGEMDLVESELRRPRGAAVWVAAATLIAIAFIGGLIVGGFNLLSQNGETPPDAITPSAPASVIETVIFTTNTPRPTIIMATVTPAPPTATLTPTEGPCMVEVQPGDSLIGVVSRCGHRDLFVLTEVMEINDLSAPEMISVGQIIEVPRPTVLPDANAAAFVPTEAGNTGGAVAAAIQAQPTAGSPPPPTVRPTHTLLPGVMYHSVQPNQSMIEIVFMYNTEAEVLEQLNPEIDFLQCDFQYQTGGESCTVLLYAGQQIRVPAPLPTATLSPTLSGSETPTPTPTPTFNAPSAISPNDRAFFGQNDLITLRWVASGTLSIGEVYQVNLIDLTADIQYTATTTDLSVIVPTDWQPTDGSRHEYSWTVSIVSTAAPNELLYTTPPRVFTWQGRNNT